jgi:hypothetical protein
MKASLNITLGLVALLSIWIVFMYPVGFIILSACVGVIAYVVTSDFATVFGALLLMVILRVLGDILKPAVGGRKEGFQAKDPITIHQRIVKEQVKPKKVDAITGILESANILETQPLGSLHPSEEGFTNSTQPAPNAMLPPIPTPAESSMPQPTTTDAGGVKMNPALITGADPAAVDAAMTTKGSNLAAPVAANMGSVDGSGPAPYA